MSRFKRVLFAVALCGALSIGIYFIMWGMIMAAVATAETAEDILSRMRSLNGSERAWSDSSQEMAITITDQRGNQRMRTLSLLTKKFPQDGEDARRTIVFFTQPQEVNGMGVLQWSKPHGEDQQWLYIPELKRTRQISGGSKTESFAGTHLTYEDITIVNQVGDWSPSDATAAVVSQEDVDGARTVVIDMTPTGKKVTYTKVRLWVRLSDSVIVQLQLFSTIGLEKTLELKDTRVIANVPTAHQINIKNERTGGHTEITVSDVRYNQSLGDDAFSQRALERGLVK